MNEVKRARHKVKMDGEIPISDMKSRLKIESASRVKGVELRSDHLFFFFLALCLTHISSKQQNL